MDSRQLREAALYHRHPRPGKIAVTLIKQLTNQYDLALAYSPGVACACDLKSPPIRASPTAPRCWARQHRRWPPNR